MVKCSNQLTSITSGLNSVAKINTSYPQLIKQMRFIIH